SQTEGLALFLEHPNFILLAASLGLLILFEGGRIPIDNPATHLELTMANKAITLEFAGRDLALIEWAEMIKMTFLFVLFGDLFLPVLPLPGSILADEGWRAGGLSVLLLVGKVLALVIVLAVWELGQPKLRLRAVLIPALVAIALSVVAIIYGFLTTALPTVGAQL
ncbi:MAG: NADH-quinone oxidoreductase subunit H, partial [Chloroflexi bacterium]|nr:NADH-quinone oxidoreductase subunit H [Chloroflexota bacterium]